MSTSKDSIAKLDSALAGADVRFRKPIIDAYVELKKRALESRLDAAGLSVGKFCEAVLRLLQESVLGKHTPFGKPISNYADECRTIIAAPNANVPEGLRVIVPRALVFAYTMRNKRGIGHVGGDVDANRIDLAAIVRVADWVICELVRVYHKMSLEEAQDLVDSLAERSIPDIWEVGGKKRVLRPGLNKQDETLLLLYSEVEQAIPAEDLCEWVEYSSLSMYRTRVLKPLHERRLIEHDSEVDVVHLSPRGVAHVEEALLAAAV
jgi:hypothetical protein